MAVAVTVILLYVQDTWAEAERADGVFNPWAETGTSTNAANVSNYRAQHPYCSNDAWSYAYADWFMLDRPSCRALATGEVAEKTPGAFFFTTAIIETSTIGWRCEAPDAPARASDCVARNHTLEPPRSDGQCLCMHSHAVYPLAVEGMRMAFELSYSTTGGSSGFVLTGSSNRPSSGSLPMDTTVLLGDGRAHTFANGQTPTFTVGEWLRAAGASLDQPNEQLTPDYRNGSVYPRLRSSGLHVAVEIYFSNGKRTSSDDAGGPPSFKPYFLQTVRDVQATVRLVADTSSWAGNGPIMNYPLHASVGGRVGPGSFHKVETYRQGVVFLFRTRGLIYYRSWTLVLATLLSFVVLLQLAGRITELVVFYLLPYGVSYELRQHRSKDVRVSDIVRQQTIKRRQRSCTSVDIEPNSMPDSFPQMSGAVLPACSSCRASSASLDESFTSEHSALNGGTRAVGTAAEAAAEELGGAESERDEAVLKSARATDVHGGAAVGVHGGGTNACERRSRTEVGLGGAS